MNTDSWNQLLKIVEILIIPFGAYVIKTLAAIQKEIVELKTVLIGVDGRNGIRSRVIRVERKVERLSMSHLRSTEDDELDE